MNHLIVLQQYLPNVSYISKHIELVYLFTDIAIIIIIIINTYTYSYKYFIDYNADINTFEYLSIYFTRILHA